MIKRSEKPEIAGILLDKQQFNVKQPQLGL